MNKTRRGGLFAFFSALIDSECKANGSAAPNFKKDRRADLATPELRANRRASASSSNTGSEHRPS